MNKKEIFFIRINHKTKYISQNMNINEKKFFFEIDTSHVK